MCYVFECLWDGSCKRAKGEPRLHWMYAEEPCLFIYFFLDLSYFFSFVIKLTKIPAQYLTIVRSMQLCSSCLEEERKFCFFFLVIPPWMEAWKGWHSGFWEEVWGREHCKIHRGLENLDMASDFLATEKERSGFTKSVGALVLRSGF